MEKANLECIKRLLKITKGEHNHELLLYVTNLRELGASLPYIVPVIPHPLLAELIKGEHFVLADLLKSILGSFSQVGSAQEQKPQIKIAEGALASFFWLDQSPLALQDS